MNNGFIEINKHLLISISFYLEINDINNLSLSCKKFNKILQDNQVRFPLFLKKITNEFHCWPYLYQSLNTKELKNKLIEFIEKRELDINKYYALICLIDKYKNYKKICRNIDETVNLPDDTLPIQHQEEACQDASYSPQAIATDNLLFIQIPCREGDKICAYDKTTRKTKEVVSLSPHKIVKFAINGNRLHAVSNAEPCALITVDLSNFKTISTVPLSLASCHSLLVHKEHVYVSNSSGFIYLFASQTGNFIKSVQAHNDSVYLYRFENEIISYLDMCVYQITQFKFFDCESLELTNESSFLVDCVPYNIFGPYFMASSLSRLRQDLLFKVKNFKELKFLKPKHHDENIKSSIFNCASLLGNFLFLRQTEYSYENRCIEVWDIAPEKPVLIEKFVGNKTRVFNLFGDCELSLTEDGTISVYDHSPKESEEKK